jgi:hypothetical protein
MWKNTLISIIAKGIITKISFILSNELLSSIFEDKDSCLLPKIKYKADYEIGIKL